MLEPQSSPSGELCTICHEPMVTVTYRFIKGSVSEKSAIDVCRQCDFGPTEGTIKDLFYRLGDDHEDWLDA